MKSFSQQQWSVVKSPTVNNLNNVFFIDSLKGWIGGDSGTIIHTTNNGQNWILQNSGVVNPVYSIFFLNENTGYALSWNFDKTPPNFYGTMILSTTNGGNNWQSYLFRDTNLFLNSIYFYDLNNGCMGGSGGNIFYTTNSGSQWIKATNDSSITSVFPVEKIKFFDSQTGYAAGGSFDIAGVMWKSTNSGKSWKSAIVGAEPLNDLYIFNQSDIICVGGDFEYGASRVSTTDGGTNWNYTEFGVFGISKSIDYRTPEEGWIALGIVDSFLVTTNSGAEWKLRPAPAGAQIFDLQFTNTRNGWAIGNNGVILKYNYEPVNVSEKNNSVPESVILHQNFPNPFNPVTKINYELPASRGKRVTNYVLIKVYDEVGKEVETLVNKKQNEGSYSVYFNGSNLASGIYFYSLTVDGISADTKRMVLLK